MKLLSRISFVDHCVGEMVSAAFDGPNAANTVVVLWSDHGFHLGGQFTKLASDPAYAASKSRPAKHLPAVETPMTKASPATKQLRGKADP